MLYQTTYFSSEDESAKKCKTFILHVKSVDAAEEILLYMVTQGKGEKIEEEIHKWFYERILVRINRNRKNSKNSIKRRFHILCRELKKILLEYYQDECYSGVFCMNENFAVYQRNGSITVLNLKWSKEQYFPQIYTDSELHFATGEFDVSYGPVGMVLMIQKENVQISSSAYLFLSRLLSMSELKEGANIERRFEEVGKYFEKNTGKGIVMGMVICG